MIRIAICDDEKDCRTSLMQACERYCRERELEWVCLEYETGEDLLEAYEAADLLLLDVEMHGIDGIGVKDVLGSRRGELRIIFVSGHEEAICDAFGRGVYGFLKKPLAYGELEKKLDAVLSDFLETESYVTCTNTGCKKNVLVSRILYIQASGKYTKVFLTGAEEYVFSDRSIGSWKQELKADDFCMCHRSYLVHLAYVKRLQQEVWLSDGSRLPMSRRMERELREAYREYVWRKAR